MKNYKDINEPTFVNPDDWASNFWKRNYRVTLDMGVAFWVNAYCEQDAIDTLIDFMEEDGGYPGFVATIDGLEEDDVEELICGGNHGLYLTTDHITIKEVNR